MRKAIFILLIFIGRIAFAQDSLSIASWNLENYFDTFDDTLTMDDDFTPKGAKHWTVRRYRDKRDKIAKTIAAMGSPDIVGLLEVENRYVLNDLTQGSILRKAKYQIIHYDSPDRRGIDCALLYRQERIRLINAKAESLSSPQEHFLTRDILIATAVSLAAPNDTVGIIVTHLPSKKGGSIAEKQRNRGMRRIGEIRDSLLAGCCSKVAIMGDFNQQIAPGTGLGSYKYQGTWEWIDQIFVFDRLQSSSWESCGKETRAMALEWLLVEDPRWLGRKPFRTYRGDCYDGGVSDHLPIARKVRLGNL